MMGIRRVSKATVSSVWYFLLILEICSCGLYEPKQEQKPADQSPQQVNKLPLPKRDVPPPTSSPALAPTEKKDASSTDDTAHPVKPGVPAAVPVKKNAQTPNETVKKADLVATAEKKAQPMYAGPKEQKLAVAKVEQKNAPQVKKAPLLVKSAVVPATKETKTPVVSEKAEPKEKAPVVPAKKMVRAASTRNWSVVAGPYVLEEYLAADLAKAKNVGVNATVQPWVRKKNSMHRLLLGQFDSREVAQGELEKLKKHTSDAFVLDHGNKFTVYAGSYLLDSRVTSEKERLAAAGFTLSVKRADVAIPSKRLMAGVFRDKSAAEATAKKLKDAGLQDVQVRQ